MRQVPQAGGSTRRQLAGALLLAAWLGAGCASLPTPTTAPIAGPVRSGRLAMSVQDRPEASFSAQFELRGTPQAGELSLLSPLGSALARLRWGPGDAVLEAAGRAPQRFESLDAMLAQASGTPLPVAALFDWLEGRPTPVPGWEPDLSGLDAGRLRARRLDPPPQADLRVVLER